MIKILEYGNDYVAKCSKCGTVYAFDKDDVNYELVQEYDIFTESSEDFFNRIDNLTKKKNRPYVQTDVEKCGNLYILSWLYDYSRSTQHENEYHDIFHLVGPTAMKLLEFVNKYDIQTDECRSDFHKMFIDILHDDRKNLSVTDLGGSLFGDYHFKKNNPYTECPCCHKKIPFKGVIYD